MEGLIRIEKNVLKQKEGRNGMDEKKEVDVMDENKEVDAIGFVVPVVLLHNWLWCAIGFSRPLALLCIGFSRPLDDTVSHRH